MAKRGMDLKDASLFPAFPVYAPGHPQAGLPKAPYDLTQEEAAEQREAAERRMRADPALARRMDRPRKGESTLPSDIAAPDRGNGKVRKRKPK